MKRIVRGIPSADPVDAAAIICSIEAKPTNGYWGDELPAEIATYATPQSLFRYRSLQTVSLDDELKAIEEDYIYCPLIEQMNDPMEGSHSESKIYQALSRYRRDISQIKKKIASIGIASLSESNLSEPMWAHYGGKFEGICIEYSLARLSNNLVGKHAIVRMQYSESPPILSSTQDEDVVDKARMALSAKTLRWSVEREWRLLGTESGPISYKPGRVVTNVYVGSRMKQPELDEVIRRMHALYISVHQMKIDKYTIQFEKHDAPKRPPPWRPTAKPKGGLKILPKPKR